MYLLFFVVAVFLSPFKYLNIKSAHTGRDLLWRVVERKDVLMWLSFTSLPLTCRSRIHLAKQWFPNSECLSLIVSSGLITFFKGLPNEFKRTSK